MRAEAQISHWQVTAYIVSLILPTGILFVPSITAQSAGPDAWAYLLVALPCGLLVAGVASALASRFPDETVVEYAPKILGKFLGKAVGFIYAFYFYYVAYYVQRQFAELMSSAYLVKTPEWVLIVVFTVIACYALYLGIEPLARTNSIILAILLVSITIMCLFVIKDVHLDNFTPVLAVPVGRIVFGALAPSSWFTECAVILMLVPFLADKKKAARATAYAVVIIFFFMFLVTICAIGVFGSDVVARMVFPTFSLVRITRFELVAMFDRIDVLFLMVWVAGMYFKLITFFYVGTLAFAQLFGLPSYRTLIIPGGILLTVLSLNSWNNITELLEFSGLVFPPSLIFVNFFLTVLLFLLSFRNYPTAQREVKHD